MSSPSPTVTVLMVLDLAQRVGDEALTRIRHDLLPWIRHLDGFRGARWLVSDDRGTGVVLVEFGSPEAAAGLVTQAAAQRREPARSWNVALVVLLDEAGVVGAPPDLPRPRRGSRQQTSQLDA